MSKQMYTIELRLPHGAKIYYSEASGFHLIKGMADTCEAGGVEDLKRRTRDFLVENWHLNRSWSGWRNCNMDDIEIISVPV
jgi:hypothetical protein